MNSAGRGAEVGTGRGRWPEGWGVRGTVRSASLDPRDAQGPLAPDAPLDPLVEACVADALAPSQDLLPEGAAAEMRAALALLLEAHSVLAPMLDGLRPRPLVASSGDVEHGVELGPRSEGGVLAAPGRPGQGSGARGGGAYVRRESRAAARGVRVGGGQWAMRDHLRRESAARPERILARVFEIEVPDLIEQQGDRFVEDNEEQVERVKGHCRVAALDLFARFAGGAWAEPGEVGEDGVIRALAIGALKQACADALDAELGRRLREREP